MNGFEKGMSFKRLLVVGSALIVGGIVLTTGCSSMAKRQWLTLFFDGVPSETSATNKAAAQVSTNKNRAAAAPKPAAPSRPKAPEKFVHRPVLEGKCIGCHGDITISPKAKAPLRQRRPRVSWPE